MTPDLTCMGKVIGGGLPVGAFGGKKEIMSMVSPAGGCSDLRALRLQCVGAFSDKKETIRPRCIQLVGAGVSQVCVRGFILSLSQLGGRSPRFPRDF